MGRIDGWMDYLSVDRYVAEETIFFFCTWKIIVQITSYVEYDMICMYKIHTYHNNNNVRMVSNFILPKR